MPEIRFHVSESIADEIHRRARMAGVSTAHYLAEFVQTAIRDDWPQDFFETVVGGWQGEPLTRPPQGEVEEREFLWPSSDSSANG